MLTRRTLLQTLAALPLCGWLKPKDNLGGFVVPEEFRSAIESGETLTGTTYHVPVKPMTLKQCAMARGVYLTPELVKDNEVMAAMFKADFDRQFKETFGE